MSDDLITHRQSELNERLREAWDDGYAEGASAERNGESSPNPYASWRSCEWPPGCALRALDDGHVCAYHAGVIAALTRPRED